MADCQDRRDFDSARDICNLHSYYMKNALVFSQQKRVIFSCLSELEQFLIKCRKQGGGRGKLLPINHLKWNRNDVFKTCKAISPEIVSGYLHCRRALLVIKENHSGLVPAWLFLRIRRPFPFCNEQQAGISTYEVYRCFSGLISAVRF